MQRILFYGAKSLALGMYMAHRYLYPDNQYLGFVVNSRKCNPETLAGLPVMELEQLNSLSEQEKQQLLILIATPEDMHQEILKSLDANGFKNTVCMTSRREAGLMEQYFMSRKLFPSLHQMKVESDGEGDSLPVFIYQAKFVGDRPLKKDYNLPEWILPIQVGAALTSARVTELCDNTGINISEKNVNYCELTALYWLWKNEAMDDKAYYGLFHYRRILDIEQKDLQRMKQNQVDVVLPFPTLHEPNMEEHHCRYILEGDWNAMQQALHELQPEYANILPDILSQKYMYNYNMLVATKKVINEYCSWLFPILKRTEELSRPRGWERADRYMGYIAESLMTLYFLYHRDRLKLAHTGRIMLT